MKETSLLRLLPCTPEDTRCKRDASRAAGTQLLLRVLLKGAALPQARLTRESKDCQIHSQLLPAVSFLFAYDQAHFQDLEL